ncbi:prohibitin family protein, partial [Candidatus Micrarchaeota archaeon]|nr:prohibitin family protein [Candidatus Micrarchaeota archaeon]
IRSQAFNMHKGGDDVAVSVLTAEGLDVNVDVSVIYHLERGKSAEIHRNVGELYSDVLIKPVSRATVRDLVSTYRSEDLYTTEKRVTLQTTLTEKIRERLEPRGIEIENVLIRDIELPIQVKSSIESKITAEQDAKRMEFVLQKEQKEAERKIVEAGGVAESQKIISASLDDKLLTWFWIKSLEKQNSVIYVPIGESGLPLFKDIDAVKTQPKPVSNDS